MRNVVFGAPSWSGPGHFRGLTLGRLIRKLQRNWLDSWCCATAKKSVAYTLLFPFCERNLYRIYRADLNRIRNAETESPTGFEFGLLRPDDDRYIRQIESQAEWLAGRLKAKLEGNGACLAALYGDKVAGFNLIAFGEVFIPLVHLKRRF